LTDVPTSGNSPHHLGPSIDGKTLVGGGLLSLLKTQDTAFYWDVQDPYRPSFKKSNRAVLSSIVDEIRAKPDGGFFITYMLIIARSSIFGHFANYCIGEALLEHLPVVWLRRMLKETLSMSGPKMLKVLSTFWDPSSLPTD
jgi:hypothetical protein